MANFNRTEKRFTVFFFVTTLLPLIGVQLVIAQLEDPQSETESTNIQTDISVLASTQSLSTVTPSPVGQSYAQTVHDSMPRQSDHQAIAQSAQEQQMTATAAAAADIQGNASQTFVSNPEAEAAAAANDSFSFQSTQQDGLVAAETTASAVTLFPWPPETSAAAARGAPDEAEETAAVTTTTAPAEEEEDTPPVATEEQTPTTGGYGNNYSTTNNATTDESNALEGEEEDLATAITEYATGRHLYQSGST